MAVTNPELLEWVVLRHPTAGYYRGHQLEYPVVLDANGCAVFDFHKKPAIRACYSQTLDYGALLSPEQSQRIRQELDHVEWDTITATEVLRLMGDILETD